MTGEVGPLSLPVAPHDANLFLALPPLLPSEHTATAQILAQVDPALPRPPVSAEQLMMIAAGTMTPCLTLHSVEYRAPWLTRRQRSEWMDFATASFDYDGSLIQPDESTLFVTSNDGRGYLLEGDTEDEARRLQELSRAGLQHQPQAIAALAGVTQGDVLRTYNWSRFIVKQVPRLRELGWRVDITPDFRYAVEPVDTISWDLQPSKGEPGWLDMALDIEVGGKRMPLAPLLRQLLDDEPRWTRGSLDAINDAEQVLFETPSGGRVALQAQRLKPLIALLGDLFGQRKGPLRIAAQDRGRLRTLQDNTTLTLGGEKQTRAMVQRLIDGPAQQPAQAPAGLQATLRPYQLDGLSWLQYLRQHDLAGVLADDMGLGKTLQVLAHVLLEKEQGRLQQPALVVVPTSLLGNWQDEAARFAPDLKVLLLHGPMRESLMEQIPQHDLVLTTYPLIWRDQQALQAHHYHLLILDEAQQVKNAKSRAAASLRALPSTHRLCMTGTPLENHLGELWAHFDFLLPHLLGNEKLFNQYWRTPIERDGDRQRAQLLAQRMRPFMLRRRKDEVVADLPPKTLITRQVRLESGQRDLYETVRAAMEKQVRDAIASKGMAKSHIVVLDALLKLRQVCCDPRLLAGAAAGRSPGSAKLDLLLEMLPELVEEGRRVLVFSQFTGMLDLIGKALQKGCLPYVELTGQTRDRKTPIKRFQNGDVPIFLISLKAGGVGLNLTAADTVVHFDPWWNPAAENQATDRAHRIGQESPVFVYRLIVEGSIEERIAALQARKSALASSILDGGDTAAPRFTDDDLQALLAPLPGTTGRR